MPNKLSQFWQELKRRRVVHVITVYASAAFVIIELINNLTEPLNLPSNLATIVIIVLGVGFPLAVVLSWIYDLTSEGIEKTKPLSETREKEEKSKVPNAWKIATYVSFVVIIGLVTFNILGSTKGLRAGDIQSMVILPFDNLTGDDQLDYVAAGMHASLIGDMGRISNLRVISKTSASVYQNMDKSLPQIADELNVQVAVEPTVMCYGDSVCLQIRVMTMYPEEKQLWIREYKEDKAQILNLYNRIIKQVADEIMVELTPEEEQLLSKSKTIDGEAYDEYLSGLYFIEDGGMEALSKAMENLNSAIEKDPEWAPLYTGLAGIWIVYATVGLESHSVAYQHVYENLEKALELDPNLSDAHFISAMSAYLNKWNWDKSEKEFIKALAINPNDAMSRIFYSHLLSILQRYDEAITQGQLALDLDPINREIQALYAALCQCVGDCETANTYYEKVLAVDPQHFLANENMIMSTYQCGEYERGWEALKLNLIQKQIIEIDEINKIDEIFNNQGFIAVHEAMVHHLEGLAESGYVYPINMISPADMAYYCYLVNQDDKAIKWLEKGFEMHHPIMPYVFTSFCDFSRLRENPRFIDIARKMNLPLP